MSVRAGSAAALANAFLVVPASFMGPSQTLSLLFMYTAIIAFVSGVEAALAPQSNCGSASPSIPGWPAHATCLLLLAVWLGSPLLAAARPSLWEILLGSIALMAGAALRATAILHLGARFNSNNHIEADAALETGGLYRCFAHPSELGLLLLAAGAALFWGAATLWIMPPLYIVTVGRLSLEETALSRRHGVRYALYRCSTIDPFPNLTPRGGACA